MSDTWGKGIPCPMNKHNVPVGQAFEKAPYNYKLTTSSWFAYVSEHEECLLEDVLIAPVCFDSHISRTKLIAPYRLTPSLNKSMTIICLNSSPTTRTT